MIRIVQLTLADNHIDDFIQFVSIHRSTIASMPGCKSLDILQDIENPSIFITYSRWDHPTDLDRYRSSDFFRNVWSQIKPWFAKSPQAWSTEALSYENAE